jgi:hypothetical protein
MNEVLRKFIVVPFIFAVLGIAYLLMCLLVFLTRGKRWPLEKKLAIGCLLVSLNVMSPIQSWARPSCYEPPSPPQFTLDSEGAKPSPDTVIIVKRNATDVVPAILRYGQSYRFTFEVLDGARVLTEGEVLPVDGNLDNPEEPVKLVIDYRMVPAGIYNLVIYWSYRSGNKWRRMDSPIRRLKLKVQEE